MMIRSWIADAGGVRELPCEQALAAATTSAGMVWVDLEGVDDALVAETLAPLAIHPLVLEDMVQQVNRPKVDNYGNYLYLVLHSARWDSDRPALKEIDMVLGTHFLITYHDEPTRSVTAAQEVLSRRPELLSRGPSALLHYMLDVIVDHYLPITDRIGEEIDEFEELIFDEMKPNAHLHIIRLKRGMAALRRIIGPQRDTVLALTRDEFAAIPAAMRPYLRDVYDRLARLNDLMDSYRDESTTLLDLQQTLTSNRLNAVIKRLTVIATVGLPLTVITSYYGMNFDFLEYHWKHAWAYVLGLLLATAGATWWYLRRNRWD